MAFFKKLKNNIGIEEEEEKAKKSTAKKKPEAKKEPEPEPSKPPKEEKKEEKKEKPKKKESDWLKSNGQLAVDVYQTADEFCIQAPIAGVSQEDIDISIENDMLVIQGTRKEPDVDKEKKHFYKECYWGNFSRQIILPEDVNVQKIRASLKHGILTVKLPIKKAEKRKVIITVE